MEIILIRHGKPTGATNPKLTATGFAHWVRNYNRSKIETESMPPDLLARSLDKHFIITSDLARAIHSANLCLGKDPDLKLKQLREMDIPRYKIPFVLNAYTWLVINRILWLAGIKGKVESFKAAKVRAKLSAEYLDSLAKQHKNLAVFGHGLTNRYVAKELVKLGWNCSEKGKSYWGVTKLNVA